MFEWDLKSWSELMVFAVNKFLLKRFYVWKGFLRREFKSLWKVFPFDKNFFKLRKDFDEATLLNLNLNFKD